ncbi:ribosomal 40S subunit protein S1B, partial [Tulasnella sp. 403]
NKKTAKGGKGGKKKIIDPFSRKDWYDIRAPNTFEVQNVGKTMANRSTGMKSADDSLKGRNVEISIGDLNKDEENSFRKIKLRIDQVQGKKLLTSFAGMDFTTDKVRSLVRKWHTLIEAVTDVKTTDGYLVRLFCIAFTKRRPDQVKKTTYAKTSQVKEIRRKMLEIMVREASSCDMKALIAKFIPEVIGREIEKATFATYPLQNIFIRKAKIVKGPKMDTARLLELHGETTDESGVKVIHHEYHEPEIQDEV